MGKIVKDINLFARGYAHRFLRDIASTSYGLSDVSYFVCGTRKA
jgi:hypothetical protein